MREAKLHKQITQLTQENADLKEILEIKDKMAAEEREALEANYKKQIGDIEKDETQLSDLKSKLIEKEKECLDHVNEWKKEQTRLEEAEEKTVESLKAQQKVTQESKEI